MSTAAGSAAALTVRRTYRARRERVFSAWTDPRQLERWFGPADYAMRVVRFELAVGGHYEFEMRPGEGAARSIVGEFVEIEAPARLAFSWTWVGDDDVPSLVTVHFNEREDGTEVLISHERLADDAQRAAHLGGWEATLACLADYLAREGRS